MTKDTTKLAYLMGVPDEIITTMSEENDILSQFYQYSHSSLVRAYFRARQVMLFHFTNGKKIFELPDSLRSYCPDGVFDELVSEYKRLYDAWEFANAMTERILGELPEALDEMRLPNEEALKKLLFFWPTQNKTSFTALSEQYHNKKFRFPYECFIPKPSTFGTYLPNLLSSDQAFYASPPIKLAISADSEVSEGEREEWGMAPDEWVFPHVRYIDHPFKVECIESVGGCQINYVDFDNTPPYVIAQLCSSADAAHRVKIFYDDRSYKSLDALRCMPHVSLCNIERLKSEKSLVDSQIIAECLQDLLERKCLDQAVLYSGDSDFYVLAGIFARRKVSFSVVSHEKSILRYYVEKLKVSATCYILSDRAIIPVVDAALVRRLLCQQLLSTPLVDCSLAMLVKMVLSAFAEDRFRPLLYKQVEKEVISLLENARFSINDGRLSLSFLKDIQ